MWVAASPGPLFFDYELSKTTDEKVFTIGQGTLHDFQELLNNLPGLVFLQAKFQVDFIDDIIFGKGHKILSFHAALWLFQPWFEFVNPNVQQIQLGVKHLLVEGQKT